MEIIETYWFAWALGFVLFAGLAMRTQFNNIKSISKSGDMDRFFGGFAAVIVCMILAWASAALLVISIIINVVQYLKVAA